MEWDVDSSRRLFGSWLGLGTVGEAKHHSASRQDTLCWCRQLRRLLLLRFRLVSRAEQASLCRIQDRGSLCGRACGRLAAESNPGAWSTRQPQASSTRRVGIRFTKHIHPAEPTLHKWFETATVHLHGRSLELHGCSWDVNRYIHLAAALRASEQPYPGESIVEGRVGAHRREHVSFLNNELAGIDQFRYTMLSALVL